MKAAVYTVLAILLTILQTTFVKYITIFGVKPNLMLIFVICIALVEGAEKGAIIGFFCGVFVDLLGAGPFGYNTLSFLYLALLCGTLRKTFFVGNHLIASIFTMIASAIYGLVYYIFFIYFWQDTSFLLTFFTRLLPECIYNGILAFLLYHIVKLPSPKEEPPLNSRYF